MKKQNRKLVMYVLIFFLLAVLQIFGARQDFFEWSKTVSHIIQSIQVSVVALVILEIVKTFIKNTQIRHTIRNLLFVGTAIVILFIFQEQFIAVGVSLGIIAALLTIILQSAIVSVAGWAYLRFAGIYKEGDRIRIGSVRGNVIDITVMNTKIQEIGSEYVMNDLPSGRLYTFPNSQLFSEPVANYSKDFPYVWIDIPFHLTYETDFPFVIKKIDKIMDNYLMRKRKKISDGFDRFCDKYDLDKKKFDPIQYNYVPQASFIEFRVTFPVKPEKQTQTATDITQEIIEMFNKYPDKVRFPVGRSR